MTVEAVDTGPKTVTRRAVVNVPAPELFAMLADPHRHQELDGSGSVKAAVKGPHQVKLGDRFTVAMKMWGLPYKLTSQVSAFEQDRLIEWQHPAKHLWRWELKPLTSTSTEVTETWDARPSKAWPAYTVMGMVGRNTQGIEKTLAGLQQRYS
jgi:hypothetical protein